MTTPCGQHTVFEPLCQTCRRLGELEAELARVHELMGDAACHGHGMGQASAEDWIQAAETERAQLREALLALVAFAETAWGVAAADAVLKGAETPGPIVAARRALAPDPAKDGT